MLETLCQTTSCGNADSYFRNSFELVGIEWIVEENT